MSPEHLRVICVVYFFSLMPLFVLLILHQKKRIPDWIVPVYLASFVACAIGWELWFTYGLVAGDPVDLRRAEVLSTAIPIHLNWLLNSLGDAGSICLIGLFLVWKCIGDPASVFVRWHWGAFFLLLTWFLGQNILVEMFLYQDQLAEGKLLSWAPLAPTGPWFNPTLFVFNGRTVTLQGQLPWVIMTPLYCWALVVFFRSRALRSTA
jgi:hypothetical protein